ncbi:MAG: ATP-binding protein [Pseudomonadales bacterium]|nr:ATP-binding protein [Pseudomonadales bacterium]
MHPRYRSLTPLLDRPDRLVLRGERVSDGARVLVRQAQIERGDARVRERYAQEFTLGRELDHDACCRPLALMPEPGRPTLELQDPGGLLLRDWLAGGPGLAARLTVAVAISHTLARLHALGVLHRDFGPEHLLILPSGDEARLIDLSRAMIGARAFQDPVHPRELPGQLDTLAPEQTGRLNRSIDRRADLYALGATLYELFAGLPPFAGSDPLELVHAHLARTPIPLGERDPALPVALQALVARLLSKRPEDRPDSMLPVLETLAALAPGASAGRANPFRAGSTVRAPLLPRPSRIYGREPERQQLLEAMGRCAEGANLFRVMEGPDGSGKSTLVRGIAARARTAGWTVLTAEFERLRARGLPPPLVQAFRPHLAQLLTEGDAVREAWQERIAGAVGDHVGSLLPVLPELGELFPDVPLPTNLSPVEAERRFEFAFRRFVASLANPEAPLLFVLEHCEWIDDDSRRLLQRLGGETGVPHLFLLGTSTPMETLARDDEGLEEAGEATRITLDALPLADCAQLIADTLGRSASTVTPLLDVVHGASAGIPARILTLLDQLRRDGSLFFDTARGAWHWHGDRLTHFAEQPWGPTSGDDVVLAGFDRDARDALSVAAAIGERFDLRTLAATLKRSIRDTLPVLRPAIDEGLIEAAGDPAPRRSHQVEEPDARIAESGRTDSGRRQAPPLMLRFARAETHAAVYGALEADQLDALHDAIGRQLLAQAEAVDDGDLLQQAVAQLNLVDREQAPRWATDPEARRSLAQLNLGAGAAALAASRPRSGFRFLRTGLGQLGATAWRDTPNLALSLTRSAMHAALLCGDPAQVERLGRAALSQPEAAPRELELTRLVARALFALRKDEEALALALPALSRAGHGLSERWPGPLLVGRILRRSRRLAGRILSRETRMPLPRETATDGPKDPGAQDGSATLDAARLLCEVLQSDWFRDRRLMLAGLATLLDAVDRCPDEVEGAYALACAGALCSMLGRREDARRMRQAAEVLLTRASQGRHTRTALRARLVLAAFVLPILLPPGACERALVVVHDDAVAAGDIELAALAASAYAAAMTCAGIDGRAVLDNLEAFSRTLAPFPEVPGQELIELYRRFLAMRLDDTDQAREQFDGEQAAAALRPAVQEHAVLLDAWDALLEGRAERAREGLSRIAASPRFAIPDVVSARVHGLLALAELEAAPSRVARRRVRRSIRRIVGWRGLGLGVPEPHLLAATLAAQAGNDAAALTRFERAVHESRSQDARLDEAVAWTWAARFCRRTGRPELADRFDAGADAAWRAWGSRAQARMSGAESEFREDGTGGHPALPRDDGLRHRTFGDGSMAEGARVPHLIEALLEQTRLRLGTSWAGLVLLEDGQLRLVAQQRQGAPATLELPGSPIVDGDDRLPVAMIRTAARTRELVRVDDPERHPLVATEPFALQGGPRALAAVPLTVGERLVGVLTLEGPQPFTGAALARLRAFTEPATVDLDNARLYEALAEARDEYRHLFEHAVEGLFRIAPDGHLQRANRALAETLGYRDRDDLLGAVTHLPRDALREPGVADALLASARSGAGIRSQELEGFGRDGAPLWLEWTLRPVTDATGTLRAFEGSLVDVTARRAREDAERARAIAEAASATKSRFLATVSHEIRTPMNAILGFADLALERASDPAQARQLETIREAAVALLGVIDDVLDLSRIEAGRMRLVTAPMDLPALLGQVEALFLPSAQSRGLALRFPSRSTLAERLPRSSLPVGDAGRLRQILVNLIGNALKFTERGAVSVDLEVPESGDRALPLILSVRDTGIGIAAEDLDRLFDAFEQADAGTTRRHAGTGLGLAICRELVALMDGRIEVESTPGEGTCFRVALALPLVEPLPFPGTQRETDAETPMQLIRGLQVLVADDNPLNRDLCRAFLESAGAHVQTVDRGDAALVAARADHYDAVVLDLHMPGLDGMDTCRALRALPRVSHPPIIAVTADAVTGTGADQRARLQAAGFDAVLHKPIDRQALLSTIARQLAPAAGGPAARDAASAVPGSGPGTGTGAPLDLQRALAHHAGRAPLLRRLLGEFTRLYADADRIARSQIQAGNLQHAARLAHDLHGVAGSFGAEPLRAAARELERAIEAGDANRIIDGALDQFCERLVEVLDAARRWLEDGARALPIAAGEEG